MSQIPQRLCSLRASSLPTRLFCRSRPPPRFGAAARGVSISSTSIKATLSTEKSVVIDGLAELARVGLAREARVRLAVRGLEGQDAAVRVAVLGRSGSEGRLVAALLADPLTTEPEEERRWMKDILSWSTCLQSGGKGALLIRHGPATPITTPPGSPIALLSVPSPLLKLFALEILLASLPSSPNELTVVPLQATEIPGARIIEFPVHKTLFWAGEGPAGLSVLLCQPHTSTGLVLKVISLPGLNTAALEKTDVMIIDLAIAEAAVTQLQSPTENVPSFQDGWLQSGLDAIRGWLVAGSLNVAKSRVKPAIKDLVFSILVETESLLYKEEADTMAAKNDRSIPKSSLVPDDAESLSRALKEWSQAAHSELQTGLAAAFAGKPWGGLAWWKLLWAADDVAHYSRDVVVEGLLPVSKPNFLFLAGRFSGAGFRRAATATSAEAELTEIRQKQPVSGDRHFGDANYCPPQISRATEYILTDAVPQLQAAANRLLVHAFLVSAGGAAVSSLLYASEVSVYSSASVATFALIYSARKLQRGWDKQKSWFQRMVMEEGRVAVVETERWAWERIHMGRGVADADADERLEKVQDGRKVLGDVRRALESL